MNQHVHYFVFISNLHVITELKHLKEYITAWFNIIYGVSLMAKSSKNLTRLQDLIHVRELTV